MKKKHRISSLEELRREKERLHQEAKLAEYGMKQAALRTSSHAGQLISTHVLAPMAIGKLGTWLLSQARNRKNQAKKTSNGQSSPAWWEPLAAEALTLGREWLSEN